jgi:hypothetical protein
LGEAEDREEAADLREVKVEEEVLEEGAEVSEEAEDLIMISIAAGKNENCSGS